MNIFEIILLAFIQGITEFLPISSSGHLIIAQYIFKTSQIELTSIISFHIGTLISIFIVLKKKIEQMTTNIKKIPLFFKKNNNLKKIIINNKHIKLLFLIIIGNIPTAIIGFILKSHINSYTNTTIQIGLMFFITGTFLWITKKISYNKKNFSNMKIKDAIIIGILQGLAILPGISRSGITISTGLLLGMTHKTAGEYSFLISIPAIIGAFILDLYQTGLEQNIKIKLFIIGTIISAIIGCISLKIILFIIKSKKIYIFSIYCYIIGSILIINHFNIR